MDPRARCRVAEEPPKKAIVQMTQDPSSAAPTAVPVPAAALARRLMRTALKASLATIDRDTGHPYPSLVLVATEPDGMPIFLISRLAQHTRNLETDPRAGLLLDGTGGLDDPLTGARVTLLGHARPITSATALPRYLSRHAAAQTYAGFADFSMYGLSFTHGHFIGGFGRIVDLAAASLLADTRGAHQLIAAEAEIVAHMNEDHADAVALLATELAGGALGVWRMVAIDPEGIDLLHCSNAARVDFATPVRTPAEARSALVALSASARSRRQHKA
jgi:heme iron utilization protein